MNISRRHFLILLPAAAVAWKSVLAGTRRASPNYKMSEHWWGMLIDIPKCIGCGNCVRACQTENDVPDGYFRTWVERYHVTDDEHDQPRGDFARRRQGRISGCRRKTRASTSLFPRCATTAPIRPARRCARWARRSSARTAWCWSIRSTAWAARIACRPAPTAAATFIREKKVADKCTLCYHRITKGLTTACCEACPTGARQLVDLKNPNDPIHEFLKTHSVQVLKPQMATGAKAYYNGLDGSVR